MVALRSSAPGVRPPAKGVQARGGLTTTRTARAECQKTHAWLHSKEHHLWRPASRTLTGARSHRQPTHVDMRVSLNEKMSWTGGQGDRSEGWGGVGVGSRPSRKTKQNPESACVAKQSKGHCKAAVPDLEQAQEAPGPGLVRTMYSSVEQQEGAQAGAAMRR